MVCTAAFSGECHGVHCCIATAPLVSVMVCTAAFSGECRGVHCCIATAPLVSVMVCTDVRDTNVYCSIIH